MADSDDLPSYQSAEKSAPIGYSEEPIIDVVNLSVTADESGLTSSESKLKTKIIMKTSGQNFNITRSGR